MFQSGLKEKETRNESQSFMICWGIHFSWTLKFRLVSRKDFLLLGARLSCRLVPGLQHEASECNLQNVELRIRCEASVSSHDAHKIHGQISTILQGEGTAIVLNCSFGLYPGLSYGYLSYLAAFLFQELGKFGMPRDHSLNCGTDKKLVPDHWDRNTSCDTRQICTECNTQVLAWSRTNSSSFLSSLVTIVQCPGIGVLLESTNKENSGFQIHVTVMGRVNKSREEDQW